MRRLDNVDLLFCLALRIHHELAADLAKHFDPDNEEQHVDDKQY